MIATLLLVLTAAWSPDSARVATPPSDSTAVIPVSTRLDSASVSPRPVLTLPEVRVEQERMPAGAARTQPTGFVSDVRAGDTGHAFETLGELLGRTAAVRIQQYGGLGSFATVSLRGAPANQLSVYLDGVPLHTAAQAIVNLSDLPVTAVDHIEIYRGFTPLSFGPATPGGAINVVTLPASALRQLSIKRGSFGTWEGIGTAGARRGAWSALGHAGYQGARGDFGYPDDNGTPLNPSDDAPSVRQNNRFDGLTLLGTVRGELPLSLGLTLRQNVFHKTQGVPGLGAVPARLTHLALDRTLTGLEVARPIVGRVPALRAQLSIDRSRSRFVDRAAELGAGAFDTDDRISGEQLRAVMESPRILHRLTLESTALVRIERANLHDVASGRGDPPESRRVSRGASLELRLEPWPGHVLLRAGRRWDRQRDALRSTSSLGQPTSVDLVREFASPQLGTQVRLPHGIELKANWSRPERSPEFLELFGNEGSVRGNPALRPERSENWDAGGGWKAAPGSRISGSLEWAHYEQRAQDLIVYVHNSASSVRALNVARARIRGEELSARLELPRGLSVSGCCAWMSTIDLGTAPAWHGRRLPGRPERHALGQLGWKSNRVEISADIEYLSEDFIDRANRMRVPARTFTGVTLGVRPLPGTRVALEAKNLGNVQASDVAGFPLPGRSLFVSCEWDPRSRNTH